MVAVIEVRTYRTIAGARDTVIEMFVDRAIPVHEEIGIRVMRPFPSLEDDDMFVWLRAFPDARSRDPMKEAFYAGSLWLEELEQKVMPLLAHYESVLVEDTDGIWDNWPSAREQR